MLCVSTGASDLITTREALDILGYTDPSTISRLVTAGRLTPAFQAPGPRGAYAFQRRDVEALASEAEAS